MLNSLGSGYVILWVHCFLSAQANTPSWDRIHIEAHPGQSSSVLQHFGYSLWLLVGQGGLWAQRGMGLGLCSSQEHLTHGESLEKAQTVGEERVCWREPSVGTELQLSSTNADWVLAWLGAWGTRMLKSSNQASCKCWRKRWRKTERRKEAGKSAARMEGLEAQEQKCWLGTGGNQGHY